MAKNDKSGDSETKERDRTSSTGDYNDGMELLDKALKELSGGEKGDAREALTKACGRFEAAVGKKGFLPEAYYKWGEALKNLAEIGNDEALFEEAIEKYMASGLQFIVDGKLMERPFIDAHDIGPKDKRHRMIFALYILTIQVIKGKTLEDNETAFLEDIRASLTSPPIVLVLIDTLTAKRRERQSVKEDDDLISIATKILINVLIDNETEKPKGPEGKAGDSTNSKKLN